jgi:hypothetical protein
MPLSTIDVNTAPCQNVFTLNKHSAQRRLNPAMITTPAAKTFSKEQLALFVANDDAVFFLEPLVDSLLANGLTAAQITDAVAASAERVLRASLTDRGLPVNVKRGVKLRSTTLKAEARRIAKELIDRLTVIDPARVPPANKRRGQPAAVAAAAAA